MEPPAELHLCAANGLNWYNSLVSFSYLPTDELDVWLRNTFPSLPEVKQFVNITSTYGSQRTVFAKLRNAFMGDSIAQVESMLALGVEVAVYVGEVDLIVNPICTRKRVDKIR